MTATNSDSPQHSNPTSHSVDIAGGDVNSPQPSLGETLHDLAAKVAVATATHKPVSGTMKAIDEAEQAIERLLASAKLEKRPIKEYDPERDITENLVDNENRRSVGYNQGAAAQYAATLVALGGREKS